METVNRDDIRKEVSVSREQYYKDSLETIRNNLREAQCKLNEISQLPGSSTWLSGMPVADHCFWLTKREFWDAICLRYDWQLTNTPSRCACGTTFSVTHALSCMLGGFVTLRHNELRDTLSPLVFSINGGMGKECDTTYKRIAQLLSDKKDTR